VHDNSIKLLKTRRFLPLFITQFLEAFNDNFFKNALVILITYTLVQSTNMSEILVALAFGIFILPYFLFSATAGQLADKYEKSFLIRIIKAIEIAAMILAAIGFLRGNIPLLMATLFLMGTHSAFFGPLKYAILPDHLAHNELIAGNAFIEASTFIAILLGTIFAGIFISTHAGATIVSSLGILIAILGLIASFYIPKAPPGQPNLTISLNIVRETKSILGFAKENTTIYLSILGISWFWLVGACLLSQFPTFTKTVLGANAHVVTLFLALFSIGIAVGSLLAERIQKNEINAKFVPLAILGMTVFIIDLYFASRHITVNNSQLTSLIGFLASWNHWRILFDIFLLAICGGIYIVPLYAIIQSEVKASHRSRIIAANNIINAIYMVLAALICAVLLALKITIPQLFLIIGVLNFLVAIYICKLLPEVLVKSFVLWLLKSLYRVKVNGLENYTQSNSRSIIVANHVSFLDALLLSAFLPDKMLFAINTYIAKKWWIRPLLTLVDTFPLDPTKPMAIKSLIQFLKNTNRRCIIFPEGRLTTTGGLMKIYEGPGLIADKLNADVLPIHIDGAQYTPFSRLKGKVRIRLFPTITLTILPPRQFSITDNSKGRSRRREISAQLYDLMTDLLFESNNQQQTLFEKLLEAIKINGGRLHVIEDMERKPLSYKQFLMRCFILGSYLAKRSQPKEKIGLLLPNTIAAAVCFFGSQAFGRVPAFLNFSAGTKNILLACQTAEIKTVYTSRKFIMIAKLHTTIEKIIEKNINVVYLEDLREKINIVNKLLSFIMTCLPQYFYRKLNPLINSNDTAVILFTSGSEGTPKGVAHSHHSILANCHQMAARIDFNSQDIAFNALPVFHCFGLTIGLILPIISGIKIFLYPSPLHYRIVPELVYDINATILFGTDTFLTGYARRAHPYDFYSIRYVFAGAEKLKDETRRLWSEKFGLCLYEGYGATETAPVISTNTRMHNKSGTVGRFLPKITYRIESVPGIEDGGRLVVSGPNLMQGYLFADNPGVIVPTEGGWYDTGDIVSVDSQGYITIKGRAKRFAKIGGEMVSLTAIENFIAALWPDKLHAIINLTDTKKGEQISLITEHTLAKRDEIVAYFKQQGIGEIYLPKKLLIIEKMPLLGTGKVDYAALNDYAKELVSTSINSTSLNDEKII
jgi:acyl-[acyl-carrier-protein]-phospholipid O-acyltransferase/long-chain-fatty-acid--[acyl-carrier-protein] ligase